MGHLSHPNCPFSCGIMTLCNKDSSGLSESTIHTASPLVQPFLHSRMYLHFTMGRRLKISPVQWLGPPESSIQTASGSIELFLQGSILRQTDRHAFRSLTVGRIYVRTAMWPNNMTTQSSYLHILVSVQPPRSTPSSSLVTLDRPPTSSSLRIN